MSKALWQIKREGVTSALDVDFFDIKDYLKACEIDSDLEVLNEQYQHDYVGNPMQDAFLSLYKPAPKLKANPGKLRPLSEIFKRAMDMPDYKKLRESTVSQKIASSIGARHFMGNILANLPDEVKDAAKQVEKAQGLADKASEQAEQLKNYADMLAANNDSEDGLSDEAIKAQELAEDAQGAANDTQQIADNMLQEFEQALKDNQNTVDHTINSAAKEAQQPSQDANEFARGFSLASGGDPQHIDAETLRNAMQVLQANPHLKELAKWLGWAKRTTRGEFRKSTRGTETHVGYHPQELEPSSLATSERLAMSSKSRAQKAGFVNRLVNGALSHRKLDGKEQENEGDIILVTDESGSMAGSPHALVTALTWALIEIAMKQNRKLIDINFSSPGQLKAWQTPDKGQSDSAGLARHLSSFLNGGTEPYQAIETALNLIDERQLPADILILTDDNFAPPSQEFLKRIEALDKIKIVTVIIGSHHFHQQGNAEIFSDKVLYVVDLINNREDLRDAIREIV